jgi:hypothetical protein
VQRRAVPAVGDVAVLPAMGAERTRVETGTAGGPCPPLVTMPGGSSAAVRARGAGGGAGGAGSRCTGDQEEGSRRRSRKEIG